MIITLNKEDKIMTRSIQQKIILEELRKTKSHPTAEELHGLVRLVNPNIGLATVYRNLDKLSSAGIINKIDGDVKRYDGNMMKHYHLRCPNCHKVEDFSIGDLEETFNKFLNKTKKNDLGINIEFIKQCKKCLSQEK